jgi:cellobiose-specific phosphotransferase system component IIC
MKGTMLFFWRREIDMKGVIEKIFHNKRISRRKRSFTTFMESGKSSQAIRKGLIFMTPLVIISSLASRS